MRHRKRGKRIDKAERREQEREDASPEADWTRSCENCGGVPVVPETGLCGPCTFGEADTADGEW